MNCGVSETELNAKIASTDEYMKLEIAQELGLLDRVLEGGWSALTAKETGRIGGLLATRKRNRKEK